MRLSFLKSEKKVEIIIPSDWYDYNLIVKALNCMNQAYADFCLDQRQNFYHIVMENFNNSVDIDMRLLELSKYLNNIKSVPNANIASYRLSDKPLISCIVILTANFGFVKNFFMPNLIHSFEVAKYPYEIIIVCNTKISKQVKFCKNFRIVKSEYGCTPKAYNAGVKEARGKYIALFHDDCILYDGDWVNKCLNKLDDNCIAVSPEIQYHQMHIANELLKVKCVPMVMEKIKFEFLEGFDEFYYAGIEDLDFTYKILSSKNNFQQVNLDYRHYNGLSTIIVSTKNEVFHDLFSYMLVPEQIINRMVHLCLTSVMNQGIKIIMDIDFVYFLRKFLDFFQQNRYQYLLEQLQMDIHRSNFTHLIEIYYQRPKYIEFLKSLRVDTGWLVHQSKQSSFKN